MLPLTLAVLGVLCVAAAVLILRSLGRRFRVGRLLAAAPQVTLAEAVEIAQTGVPRYVRIHGRVSSDEEFPDENDRPLVYRRRRVEVSPRPGRWQVLDDAREAVAFGLEERGAFIGIAVEDLADGLVVIPRLAEGVVGDLPARAHSGLDPATACRLVVEQVSAVEHAFACGVPVTDDAGVRLRAGLGRPVILTTLPIDAAMRVLAGDQRGRVTAAIALLVGAAMLLPAAALSWLIGAG